MPVFVLMECIIIQKYGQMKNGNHSPYKPWMWRDCGLDGLCPDDNEWTAPDTGEGDGTQQGYEEVTDLIGLPYTKVIFTDAEWLWKLSPRLGFSHVITDQATFTFNYGLYYRPLYIKMYILTQIEPMILRILLKRRSTRKCNDDSI